MAAASTLPPLQCMQLDDYSAADAARRRLAPKSGLRLFASLTNLRQRSRSTTSRMSYPATEPTDELESTNEVAPTHPSTGDIDIIISLDSSAISNFHENKDVYRWAVLYENQRGYVSRFLITNGKTTLSFA
jgi:hypothetical protein